MALGSDDWADAPTIAYGGSSDPTPSGPLTVEPGEPTDPNGTWDDDDGRGEIYHVIRTAWWKFIAPTTETVGVDLLQTALPSDIFAVDSIVHIYTGDSLDTLTLLAYGDDNGRQPSPDNTSKYGYLTEFDFEATAGTTYYVRAGSWDWSDEMDYVLRLGKRVNVYGNWIGRPDVTLDWPSDTQFGWDNEKPRIGYVGGQESWQAHRDYPWPGNYYTITPSDVAGAVNEAVGQESMATVLHPVASPVLGTGFAVEVRTGTTSRPDIPPPGPTGPFPQDRYLNAAATIRVEQHRPVHSVLFATAMPEPPSDPESIGIEYQYPNPDRFFIDDEGNHIPDPAYPRNPTISRDFRLRFTATSFGATFENNLPIHYAAPTYVAYEALTSYNETGAGFIIPGTENANGFPNLDLTASTTIGFENFAVADQVIQHHAPTLSNGFDVDGSFVILSRILSVTGVGSRGPSNEGDWEVHHDIISWVANYTISDISPYRYVYPTIEGGAEESRWFVAHGSEWHSTDPVIAHDTSWQVTHSDQVRLGTGAPVPAP
jgi:hypothetical protein